MDSQIFVPFTEQSDGLRTRFSITPAVIRILTRLLVEGLQTQSAERHLAILREFPARPRTARRIARLQLHKQESKLWDALSMQVQRISNRHGRDRLPVSALAIAIADQYDVNISQLIDSGFLSVTALELVVGSVADVSRGGSEDSAREPSVARVIGGRGMENEADDSDDGAIIVEATLHSPEESRALLKYNIEAERPKTTRAFSKEQVRSRLGKLYANIDQQIANLNPK